MKKKYLIIPLCLLALASCRPTLDPTSSTSEEQSSSVTSEESSSSSSSESEKTLSSIEVTHLPNKTEYYVGDTFNKTGLVVTAMYNDESSETVTGYTLSIADNYKFVASDKPTKRVTVSYENKTDTFDLTVEDAPIILDRIVVETNPTKVVYEIGGTFSLSGMVVKAYYSDDTSKTITNYTSSLEEGYVFTESDVGTKTITITYENKTDTFDIDINPYVPPVAELVGIEIRNNPTKSSYVVGEQFNTQGLKVAALYDDESSVVITDYIINPANGYTFVDGDVGLHFEVTVTYEDKQASFDIIVTEPHIKTVQEYCADANELLDGQGIENPFAARDYLLSNDFYEIMSSFDDDYLGYDIEANKIVVYSMNNSNERIISYPTDSIGHRSVSYREVEVSTYQELNNALLLIQLETNNYSTIKLTSNITLTSSEAIKIPFDTPIEFDLNGHTLGADYCCNNITINDEDAVVSIVGGGTIQTYVNTEVVEQNKKSPICVSVFTAKEVTMNDVTLDCRARYGYGVIDYILCNTSAKISLENCTVNGVSNAICVQRATFDIKDCTIDGVVNINGGNTTINHCDITAVGRHDDATGLVTNEHISSRAELLFYNNPSLYDTYMISSTDPIIIFDRRSVYGTYETPSLLVKNETRLTADYSGEIVYGYGVRYLDLQFDSSKSASTTITINPDTVFVKCTASTVDNEPGGYSRYTHTPTAS